MKVALCCIGRLENRYAKEYVEHYKNIGFDKIFIYDNNFSNEENFEDVLQPYIDDKFVEVIDYRNKEKCQLEAYTECYRNYENEYDWIAFFDFDEYLHIVDGTKIKEYLGSGLFDGFQCIHLNWMDYGDNDLVHYDDRPIQERFKEPLAYDLCFGYDFPENYHIKSIVRCGIADFTWNGTPHSPMLNLKCCNDNGAECKDSPFNPYNFDRCYLKHYFTKTIDEWLTHKYAKQYADRCHGFLDINKFIENFFKLNKRTKEKDEYIKGYFANKEIINNGNADIFVCTHKDFDAIVHNDIYRVVDTREIGKYNNLSDKFWSELLIYFNIADNAAIKDYVGFCHYRKYFDFMDNVPSIDEVFKYYDVITAKPIKFNISIKEQYDNYHNIEDLYLISGIMCLKYPEYAKLWTEFIEGDILLPYNMFIMKRNDFLVYINFMRGILDEYLKIVGCNIYKRIGNNIEKYVKDFKPNDSIDYQYRIGGYLGERLTSFFLMYYFNNIKAYDVIITEEKYI